MLQISRRFYRFGEFELHPAQRSLLRSGERITLAPKSFDVLSYLVSRHSQVVLKDEILKAVWPDAFVEESNLTQHIFWIRRALGDASGLIVTLPGRGYQFVAPVEISPEGEGAAAKEHEPIPSSPETSGTLERVQAQTVRSRTKISIEETIARPKSRWLRISAIAASAVFAGVLIGWSAFAWRERAVPGDHHAVVLADFNNATGDPDFDRALKTLLSMDLGQSPFFAITSDSDVRKTLKRMERSADTQVTTDVGREVCQRLNEQAVISGLIVRFGQKFLVTLSAQDCASGQTLAQTRASASSKENVIEAVDDAAAQMQRRLGAPLRKIAGLSEKLLPVHTFSLEALQAYSQARALHSRAKFKEAVPFYQRALQLDPNFAVAYAQLANCENNLGEAAAGEDAMAKAYSLRDHAEGADKLNITSMYEYWHEGDRHKAIKNYENWARQYPNQSNPWVLLGEFRISTGDLQGGIEAIQHAVAVNPNTVDGRMNLARYELYDGRFDEAKANANEALARGIDNAEVHGVLRDVAYLQHDEHGFDQQTRWFETKAAPDEKEDAEAYVDLSKGKVHSAIEHWTREAEMARKDGRPEAAQQQEATIAAIEAEVGLRADASATLKPLDPLPAVNIPSGAAITMAAAEIGELSVADKDFAVMRAKNPHDSDMKEFWTPEIAATLALARRNPQEAIADMTPALSYEACFPDVTSLRARAYLAAGQSAMAEQEFRRLVERPYVSVISENSALAHLGLARALAQERNISAARTEYDTFFLLWSAGDAKLPIMQQAHNEYAQLGH